VVYGLARATVSLQSRLDESRWSSEHTFVNPNQKGNVAELAIAKGAADLGLSVLKPLTEHERSNE
jgi:hypothetical protein